LRRRALWRGSGRGGSSLSPCEDVRVRRAPASSDTVFSRARPTPRSSCLDSPSKSHT
jgi:hypothetical protein